MATQEIVWIDAISLTATAGSILSGIGAIATAFIAWWQLSAIAAQTRLQGERERQWRTLEVCSRIDNDPLLDQTTKRIWDQSQGGKIYNDMIPVRRDIINLLNYLDSIAVGIGQGFYVADVARDHLEPIFEKAATEFLRAERARELELDIKNYRHILSLVDQWSDKNLNYIQGIK